MPPRNRRRVVAREPSEEEEEGDQPKNSSLRCFFPLEVVKLILLELDGDSRSLASVCLVSFGCLEEASGELYRDVLVDSDRGIISLLCGGGAKLKPRSRLIPPLSLSQIKYLTIHLPHSISNAIVPFLTQKSGIAFAPRLSSPLPLSHLRIGPSRSAESHAFQHAFDSLTIFILPYLSPTHVEINLSRWPPLTNYSSPGVDWTRTLKAWSGSFRSLTFTGGNVEQTSAFLTSSDGAAFFLKVASHAPREAALELTFDARNSGEEGRDWELVSKLGARQLFERVGIRTRIVVADEEKGRWEEEIGKLSEEEKGRVELEVAVV